MSRTQWTSVATAAIVGLLCALWIARPAPAGPFYGDKEPDVTPAAPSDDWQRMEKPKPGEWLYVFKEAGQTFAEYEDEVTNRKSRERDKLCIVPLGSIVDDHPQLVARSQEYLRVFFDTEVVQLAPERLPSSAYNRQRNQYDAQKLLDLIVLPFARKQTDALAVIGILQDDLYQADLNFVFGVGTLNSRCGVYSVHRLFGEGEDAEKVALMRTIKLASHEVGHIFSLRHCTFYHCVMNGSNSLPEADARPLFLCPVCLRKLEWNLGFDRRTRYEKMEAFFQRYEMPEQAAFCRRRIEELPKPPAEAAP